MKQVVQNLRSGKTEVMEVPIPEVKKGQLLIKTTASLVSSGTERSIVDFAAKGLLGKVRSRPDLARQIIEKARREGILTTLEMAFNRLDQPMVLGYSSAGLVRAVEASVTGFRVGERVACGGGGYAVHAEYAVVPANLVVPIPDGVDDESAAFTTVGAIAMHAFRLCQIQIGERIAIIGLGLVGLLAAGIARAAGCEVTGVDINPKRLELARELGWTALPPAEIIHFNPAILGGKGYDAVLIAADTPTNEPVKLAGKIARDRARVVAAGAVGQTLPRKLYYEKELTFINSRSYGPGRYDPTYEEKGVDYPIGYVRWTEQRNMEAFLHLLESGRVDVKPLISHRFPIERAEEAYELISGKKDEPYLGVMFTYPAAESTAEHAYRILHPQTSTLPSGSIGVGVAGAGNFASLVLLPALKKLSGIDRVGIASSGGVSAEHASRKFGFSYATSSFDDLIADERINTLFILTRHHLHALQTTAALKAGKHVFCEKPLAIRQEELIQVANVLYNAHEKQSIIEETAGNQPTSAPLLMVGFNRRFAPLMKEMKRFLSPRSQEAVVHYRVNAGYIPLTHWTQDIEQGGGRLIGEVCHFIDTVTFLLDALPVRVSVHALPDRQTYNGDNLVLRFLYPDGSTGLITYLANGDKSIPKERIEVFCGGKVAILDDFRRLELAKGGRHRVIRSILRQDKGHQGEVEEFVRCIRMGGDPPIPYHEILAVSWATLMAHQALSSGIDEEISYSVLG